MKKHFTLSTVWSCTIWEIIITISMKTCLTALSVSIKVWALPITWLRFILFTAATAQECWPQITTILNVKFLLKLQRKILNWEKNTWIGWNVEKEISLKVKKQKFCEKEMKKNMKREKKRAACFTSIGQLFGSAISLNCFTFCKCTPV